MSGSFLSAKYTMLSLLAIFALSVHALTCYPPYVTTKAGGCSLFPKNSTCTTGYLACPLDGKCVTDYNQCKLLPFQNASFSVEARVKDVVTRLTLEEKVNQLTTNVPGIMRLGIPPYNWAHEALHGVARETGLSTNYPQVIGLGATFNKTLWHMIGRAISDEARAKYTHAMQNGDQTSGITFYAPNINIYRDPRWGRGQETPGEDTYLTSMYATNYVRGVQKGPDDKYHQAVACCKHYAAYNFDNATGVDRHTFNAILSEADLSMTFLSPFEACIRDGEAQSVMCSYNAINGVPTCADPKILRTFLREKNGFDGFVVSDEGAIDDIYKNHHFVKTAEEASIVAVEAGCDQDLGTFLYGTLVDAVKSKNISENFIDESLSNLFRVRIRLGLLDNPWAVSYNKVPFSKVVGKEHTELALEAARQSIVLLKNENNMLPFKKTISSLAVVGPNANATLDLLGNYAAQPKTIVSIVEGIKAKLPSLKVQMEKGCDEVWCTNTDKFPSAISAAKSADAVLLVMGIRTCAYDPICWIGIKEIEGEQKDRTSLKLPGYQMQLIHEVLAAAQGKPVAVALINGGSITMEGWLDSVPALFTAFYPGEQGGNAIADVLFGDYNPAGRLTTSWVKSESDLPDYLNPAMKDRTYRYMTTYKPLFPFGYGLSYTQFEYTNLSINDSSIYPCQSVTAEVTVTNTGSRYGEEVVQIYLQQVSSSLQGPNIQLAQFDRIALAPKESKRVALEIMPREMARFDSAHGKVVEPGKIAVFVGGGQPEFDEKVLNTAFLVTGNVTPLTTC